jgi:hypothetical protein
MPISITFFYHDEDYEKPTMTIYLDGSCKEHGLPFPRHLRSVTQLEKHPRGPTHEQLDTVEMNFRLRYRQDPSCVLTNRFPSASKEIRVAVVGPGRAAHKP